MTFIESVECEKVLEKIFQCELEILRELEKRDQNIEFRLCGEMIWVGYDSKFNSPFESKKFKAQNIIPQIETIIQNQNVISDYCKWHYSENWESLFNQFVNSGSIWIFNKKENQYKDCIELPIHSPFNEIIRDIISKYKNEIKKIMEKYKK